MPRFRRPIRAIGVALVLVFINLIALNWSWRFFQHKGAHRVLSYGAGVPELRGIGYDGNTVDPVNPTEFNLVLYLSGPRASGRSVSLLKFCESLGRGKRSLRVSAITPGFVREVEELLRDKLISYQVINDGNRSIGERLGLHPGDDGAFLFDTAGRCRFSARQLVNPNDIEQLLSTEGVTKGEAAATARESDELTKGRPLPSWSVVEARSGKQTMLDQVRPAGSRAWAFFPFDCFACGSAKAQPYLDFLDSWQKAPGNQAVKDPILVFDSAFLRSDVIDQLLSREIRGPVYISNEEMGSLVELARFRGRSAGQPIIVTTDDSGGLVSAVMRRLPGHSQPTATRGQLSSASTGSAYVRVLQNLGVDLYDAASYGDLLYATDRALNRILVLDRKFEIVRSIGSIGSGPDRLFRPGQIDVSGDGIIYVQDGGNERIQAFALDGTHVGGFNVNGYMGFAAGAGNEIYLGQPENGSLVSVYSRTGKSLRSFGRLKKYSEVYGAEVAYKDEQYNLAINRVRLFVDRDENIVVSFMFAPIIQKYTRRGDLLFEKRLEGPELDRLVAMFLSKSDESYLTISPDGFPARVIALEGIARPDGNLNVVLVDGSVYVADKDGNKVSIVRPASDDSFTPEMTGLSPSGEVLVVGMSPRNCYVLRGL